MYKYTKYKQHIDTAVQQNALNKTHTRSCAELVHKSLYDVHATRASRSVRSQGANSVQIVSSFNLHFSSADRVEFPNCERCSVKIFFTVLKVLSGAAFELGIVSSDPQLFPTHGKSAWKATLYALAYFAFLGGASGLAAEARFIVPQRNYRSIIKNCR